MSERDKYTELLYAYSLGCLDAEDFKKLKEFLDSGGKFSWQELGEYQNLAALFPAILKMEQPGHELKDKVARKLYRLKGDKVPLKKEKKEDAAPDISEPEQEKLPENETPTESKSEEPTVSELKEEKNKDLNLPDDEIETELDLSDFEEVKAKKRDKNILPPLPDINSSNETEIKSRINEDNIITDQTQSEELKQPLTSETNTAVTKDDKPGSVYNDHNLKRKKNIWPLLITLLFILIAAGMTFMYFNLTKEVKSYKSGINKLNEKVNDLSSKVSQNESLKKIFRSKDIAIVNMIGTDLSPQAQGKLIIGTINRNCVLQLTGLPAPPGNKVYQLWLKENGSFISAGVFNPGKSENYFHFTLPDVQLEKITGFILTYEPPGGSDKPNKKIYLTGSLN